MTSTTLLCCFSLVAHSGAEQNSQQNHNKVASDVENIEVHGVRRRLNDSGALKDNIAKTELLTDEYIKNSQASSLADAIKNAVGIRVSNECSMCGAKRVMINGMKGEHTNVLIDGIPMHTMISGFYGMDSVAATGIGSIEIARGAGASLTAPEAIGGTVNMITKDATEDEVQIDLAAGELGYRKASIMATKVSDDENSHLTLVAQYDNRNQFDGDNNGVSENPQLTNSSMTIYFSHDLSYSDNLRLRYNQSNSEVFGGPVLGDTVFSVSDALSSVAYGASAQLFEDNDVRNRFIGQPWETTEWVKTDREELSASWLHEIAGDLNITTSLAYIDHVQDSFYEGVDYRADDTMFYATVRLNYFLNDEHLLSFGGDFRAEEMRSNSRALSKIANYIADSFDYITKGLFIQDTWSPHEDFELAAAIRFDHIKADFVDPSKPGTEIDKNLISPRVDMRYLHNDQITSRLSFGQGYRAPLSFFESDHGILDAGKGYIVAVNRPERSNSVNYSLNFDGEKLTSTLSFAYTEVDHLATLTHNAEGTPVLDQLKETASVSAIDLALNYQVMEEWSLSMIAEQYNYNDIFKQSFAIAPVERRVTVSSDWDYNGWDVIASATWVDNRDLTDYGYTGFNRNDATEPKLTDAKAYVTVDLKVIKELSSSLKIYIGATNLFNYSQAKDLDSPLMFHENGAYDVIFINGPLRGRSAYAGLRYEF
ncbi:MAG: TonB-dependent receptor [Gammaproteobacteria bacterium]|nr:TonB-dependent receptor [Gammaproteobacteria bacterium]